MNEFRTWLIANKSAYFEVNDQKENELLDRLRPHIDQFKDLADIKDYYAIRKDRAITDRLQEAYNIMYQLCYPKNLRCTPCEIEGLCAIRSIMGKPFVQDTLVKIDAKKARRNIEKYYAADKQ